MKEIPLLLLLKAVTLRRLWNAGTALAGFAVSALSKRPVAWGRPFILTLEPTNACNLRCPLCVTGNGRLTRPTGFMPFERFRALIDEVGDHLFYLLLYQQGEPFLHPEFLRFVEYAKRKRIFVTTSTNGHYLDRDTARGTVASGLDSLIVSVDGADQDTYARYRVRGRLQTVLQGIECLAREKARRKSRTPVIYLQFILMRHNEHQIDEMKRLAHACGADRFLQKTAYVETPEEARTWLPRRDDLRRYRVADDQLLLKRRGRGPCPRPWTSALINWDGTVGPCCFDKNARYPLGRHDPTPLHRIWENDAYTRFRTQMLNDRDRLDICANCTQGLRLFV